MQVHDRMRRSGQVDEQPEIPKLRHNGQRAHMSSVGVCRNRNLNPIFRFALRRSPYLHEHDQATCF